VRVTSAASPNYNERPKGMVVDTLVLHADASPKASASVAWIRRQDSKVSYHALVDRDGTVFMFVPLGKRAWHAGLSEYRGRKNVNDFSLGLSFANKNDGVEPYTDAQYEIGALLASEWMKRFPAIGLDRITTHAAISPGRKTDPLGFDVERFRSLIRGLQEGKAA
jgi:AmpD protein